MDTEVCGHYIGVSGESKDGVGCKLIIPWGGIQGVRPGEEGQHVLHRGFSRAVGLVHCVMLQLRVPPQARPMRETLGELARERRIDNVIITGKQEHQRTLDPLVIRHHGPLRPLDFGAGPGGHAIVPPTRGQRRPEVCKLGR